MVKARAGVCNLVKIDPKKSADLLYAVMEAVAQPYGLDLGISDDVSSSFKHRVHCHYMPCVRTVFLHTPDQLQHELHLGKLIKLVSSVKTILLTDIPAFLIPVIAPYLYGADHEIASL